MRDSDTWSEDSLRHRKNSFKMAALDSHRQHSNNGDSGERVAIHPCRLHHSIEGRSEAVSSPAISIYSLSSSSYEISAYIYELPVC